MLYLFGRLALSDSYYFNDDFQADERPDKPMRDSYRPAPDADGRPLPTAGAPPDGEGELAYQQARIQPRGPLCP